MTCYPHPLIVSILESSQINPVMYKINFSFIALYSETIGVITSTDHQTCDVVSIFGVKVQLSLTLVAKPDV